MSGIHEAVLQRVLQTLTENLITNIAADDPALAGLIKIGPMQGDPGPDIVRISVTLHENDPDGIAKGAVTGMTGDFSDVMEDNEIGGAVTMLRRFTVKGRCLLVNSREDESAARSIASTVRSRIEQTLLKTPFGSVRADDEYVSRGVISKDLTGEMLQAGGPPDAFDYLIKVRFGVLTTQTGIFS